MMGQQRIVSASSVTGQPPAGTLPGSGLRQALLPARPVNLPSVRSQTPPGTTSLPPVAPLVPPTLHTPRAPSLPPVNPSSHSGSPSLHQQAVAPLNPSASGGAPGVSTSEVKGLREEMRRMKESLTEKEGAVSILQRRLHQVTLSEPYPTFRCPPKRILRGLSFFLGLVTILFLCATGTRIHKLLTLHIAYHFVFYLIV